MAKLNPLSPEVISRQATINIGKGLCVVGRDGERWDSGEGRCGERWKGDGVNYIEMEKLRERGG